MARHSETSSLETLLRESSLTYGHIQLFRNEEGWQASVCHYEPTAVSGVTINSKVSSDPVNALRAALLEDERRGREVVKKYAAAVKVADEFEDLFG